MRCEVYFSTPFPLQCPPEDRFQGGRRRFANHTKTASTIKLRAKFHDPSELAISTAMLLPCQELVSVMLHLLRHCAGQADTSGSGSSPACMRTDTIGVAGFEKCNPPWRLVRGIIFVSLFGMAVHGPELGCIVYFVRRSAIGEWVALLHHRPSFSLPSMGLLGASGKNDPPIHYHLIVSGFSCLFE